MKDRLPTIAPRTYSRIATVAFVSLVAIIVTGAAVRLTGSGLGCPTWPRCNGHLVTTELDFHGAVEYGNRLVTGVVAIAAIAAALLAFLRRPFRKDLAVLGLALPAGVIGQIALGGFVVLYGLAPGFVMGHFLLSQLIVVAAFALMWRARRPDAAPEATEPRATVLAARAIVPIAAWVLLLGAITTGAGPHPGTHGDEVATRFAFKGGRTMDWMIHWHGRFSTFFGLCALALWFYARRQQANPGLRRATTVLCLLIAAQGVVGFIQYANELPAGLVWVHVVLATLTWVTVLWTAAAAGRLAPARAPAPVVA
ncbi:MAG: cytochrome oxidase assembly [Solirubrobacterales bacterium]|nr:cytochrome oxidase assembly [Solirubrobacterales bacterium]